MYLRQSIRQHDPMQQSMGKQSGLARTEPDDYTIFVDVRRNYVGS